MLFFVVRLELVEVNIGFLGDEAKEANHPDGYKGEIGVVVFGGIRVVLGFRN